MSDIPIIETEDRFVVLRDIPIGLEHGLHARPAGMICLESNAHKPLEAFFARSDKRDVKVSTMSVMGLLTLDTYFGTRIDIYVTQGPGAEDFAYRLYSGVTSPGLYPEFDRLVRKA